MEKYCWCCEYVKEFNENFEEGVLRCSECGTLPYNKEEWELHNKPI